MLEHVPEATRHVDQGSLWTVAITSGGSALAAILAWMTAGARARLSAEASMRASFKMLTDELQKENLRLVNNLEKQSAKIDQLTEEVASLKAQTMTQSVHIERLERALTDAGVAVPRTNRA